MKNIFKTVAAVATATALTVSFTGCGLIVDKDDIEKAREEKALVAEREQQAQETVLTIDGDIQISGAYYGYYFSNTQMRMTSEAQQAQQAEAAAASDASSDAESTSAAEIKLDIEEVKADAKDQIVTVKMACKKAAEAGIELTDDDKANIAAQVDDFKAQIQQQVVSQAGISYNDYITNFLYTNQETIEEIMKDAYIANLYNASLVADKFVSAKHILVGFAPEGEEPTEDQLPKDEALAKITDIKKQLDDGADFDKLMSENSTDPGLETQPDGYTFAKGAMVPEFEAAAFALEEGKISDIVETSYGYHILKKVPTTLSGVADALGSTADPEVAAVIEEANAALTEGVDVVEGEKISYYTVD